VLKTLAPDSIEAAVSDPPYGLGDMSPARVAECLAAWTRGEEYSPEGRGFMGKAWDAWTPGPDMWRELYRVLKPGAHALIFAGSRTQDLMSLALRLAGFEIRDTLQWLYGSGFPKSHNIAKNLDWTQAPPPRSKVYEVTKWIREARDAAGITNKDIDAATNTQMAGHWTSDKSQPAIPALLQVAALLNVLKLTPEQVPDHIVDVLLGNRERVSLREVLGTVMKQRIDTHWEGEYKEATHTIYGAPVRKEAQKWEGWGTALKPAYEPIILARKPLAGTVVQNTLEHGCGGLNIGGCRVAWSEGEEAGDTRTGDAAGRWPANVLLDEGAAEVLDAQAPGASRFFYTAKASRAEREAGLEGHATKTNTELTGRAEGSVGLIMIDPRDGRLRDNPYAGTSGATPRANTHPTVKPLDLMRYLVRLITPPGASVIDPFMGSGSTGCAAVLEGARFVGIEREAEYMNIARARIAHHTPAPPSPAPPSPADEQLSLFDTDTGTQEP
jgi:DNA modification methylase